MANNDDSIHTLPYLLIFVEWCFDELGFYILVPDFDVERFVDFVEVAVYKGKTD